MIVNEGLKSSDALKNMCNIRTVSSGKRGSCTKSDDINGDVESGNEVCTVNVRRNQGG